MMGGIKKTIDRLGDRVNRRSITIALGAVSIIAAVCLLILIIGEVSSIIDKYRTNDILTQNDENISLLRNNVGALKTDANLLKLVSRPDNTTLDVILDALPVADDSTELAAIIQKNVFEGIGVKVINITAAEKRQIDVESDDVKTTSISFSIKGSLESIIKAIRRLERSIRPIVVESIALSESGNDFVADIKATTFFISEVTFAADEQVYPDIRKPSSSVFGEGAINLKKPIFTEDK